MRTKLSSRKIARVLAHVPGTLRKLAYERDHWQARAMRLERHEEARKVASAMCDRGLNQVPFDELVRQMEKEAEQGRLGTIKLAVDMVSPDMGVKWARVTDGERGVTPEGDPLGRWLVAHAGETG